jgi:hypothetical protein
MIFTVSFHFREPFIPDIIALISFILFLVGSILLKKDQKIKGVNLLIIGGIIFMKPLLPKKKIIKYQRKLLLCN